jgi:hypothetical protein
MNQSVRDAKVPMSITEFSKKFDQIIPMIEGVLPKSMNVAAFKAGLMLSLSKNNDCLSANFQSLQVVILHAARIGVVIDGRESAIAYFYDKTIGAKAAKFYLMVDGVKKLFHAAGFKQFDALPVYKGDIYRSWIDETGAHFKHERSAPDERGNLRFYYAYVITKEGELFHEEMTIDEIEKIRAVAAKDHVWASNFGEQARKTLFHRISKRVKKSPELIYIQNGIESEFDFKDVTPINPMIAPPPPPQAQSNVAELHGFEGEKQVVWNEDEVVDTNTIGAIDNAPVEHAPAPPPVDKGGAGDMVELDESTPLFKNMVKAINSSKTIEALDSLIQQNDKFIADTDKLTKKAQDTLKRNIDAKRDQLAEA